MDIEAARKIAHAIATPYARRFCLDADEARQVAWIAAWLACSSHDPARAKLSTWIGKRVRHALADWRRNTGEWGQGSPVVGCARTGRFAAVTADERLGAMLADERGPPGWVAVDDADEAAAITRRAFGGELLRRRYLAGETVSEIAATLGVHTSRVDQILRQAIAEIRAEAG